MATIVTRAGKGGPLTHNEVDANFTNLNTDKAETSSLATVATTGAYSDLTGTPTLGTAAAADTGDFVAQTSATGAASIPSGTEAQRPTPAAGQLRFNTDAGTFEGYDGTEWGAIAGGGEVSLLNYNFTATAGQTTFSGADDNAATLSYTQQNLIVTLNGIVLEDGTDYTASNGTSIVLASGAAAGDELNVVAFKSFTTADMVPASTGGTFSGNVTVDGALTTTGQTNTGSVLPSADATSVLGGASNRYTNLYLSGGVYLGDTGAANYLDDFEEGTFTPTITFGNNNTGMTFSTRGGFYTKVGRLVTVMVEMTLSAKGSSTGSVKYGGLPFTAKAGTQDYCVALQMIRHVPSGQDTIADLFHLFPLSSSTHCVLRSTISTSDGSPGDGNYDNDTRVSFTLSYLTDA